MAVAPLPPLSLITTAVQSAGSTQTVYSPAAAPAGAAGSAGGAAGASFGQMLNRALEQVNDAQVRADQTAEQFFTGRLQDIHQVTIAMEEARIMMDLAVEVSSKVVQAYQQVAQMQF